MATRKVAKKHPAKGRTTAGKRPAVKKVASKKKVAGKAVAKKVVARKPARNTTPVKAKMTKSAIYSEIVGQTGLSRMQVASVFDELKSIIDRHVSKRAVGEFNLEGLLKIKRVVKPARKARKNIPHPFRPGETYNVAAKPASSSVRVVALKQLKDMVS